MQEGGSCAGDGASSSADATAYARTDATTNAANAGSPDFAKYAAADDR